MKRLLTLCFALMILASAQARAAHENYYLPLDLAVEAGMAAIKACELEGYKVTVTIVDVAGYKKLQLKGDGSTIHTKDSSYGKAYTMATMGPVFKSTAPGNSLPC